MPDDRGSEIPRRATRVLVGAVLLATLVSGITALRWSARHPLGTSWDESDYVNQVVRLVQDAHAHGVVHGARLVRWTDNVRPPAYRLAAAPFAYLLGSDPRILRALSLAVLLLTGALVYRAARLVSRPPVAAAAAAVMLLSYAPLWASAHFGTEYVVYLATAGLCYGLLYCVVRRPAHVGPLVWAGLVAGVALGALSKTSFAVLAIPAVLTLLVVGWRFGLAARVLWVVGSASGVAMLLVAPWWAVNARAAMAYARYASGFVRHGFPWLPEAFWRLLGPPMAALFLCLLVVLVVRRRLVWQAMTPQFLVSLAVCLAGAAPLFLTHLFGANHNMRLVSPALIPVVLGAALLAQASAALDLRHATLAVGAAIVLQGTYMGYHFTSSSIDQWDWEPLRVLCAQHGLPYPDVRYLGNGITFNPAAISYPWVAQGDSLRAAWLWRYEDGPIDWARITAASDSADVVLTAPGYAGDALDKQPLDNQYNGDLARTLEGLPEFEPAAELQMGSFHTRVLAFFRRRGPEAARSP